jgi:hypothetical protein
MSVRQESPLPFSLPAVVDIGTTSVIKRVDRICGVYVLVDFADTGVFEFVYVGQSVNVISRVTAHHHMKWNRAVIIPCAPDQLDAVERTLIVLFFPDNNRAHMPPNGQGKSILVDAIESSVRRVARVAWYDVIASALYKHAGWPNVTLLK